MLNISLEVDLIPDDDYRNRAMQILLWTLIHLNELYLERFPYTPGIYDAGVKYIREPLGYEQWTTIPTIIAQGGADCEDLACWRIAELRMQGINARPRWRNHPITGPDGMPGTMYHILVHIPGGTYRGRAIPTMTDDPSKRLGMRGLAA